MTGKFPLPGNTTYTFSASMKTSGLSNGLTVYLIERNASGVGIQTGLQSSSGTTSWKTYNKAITTRPDTVEGYLKVYISSGYGTAWLDDIQLTGVFGGNVPVAFGGTVTSSGGVLTQTASKNGLNLSAKFTSVGSAIKVDATVTDTTGADRAFELSYRLPLDIAGWIWDDDFVTPMTIASGTRYEHLDKYFGIQTKGHTHSVYPFATVRNAAASFSLAVPMGPLMYRFSYDDFDGFRITYDLGLSTATTKSPSKATVSFWIYTQNPKWGMRSAAEKYYALNPASFTTSATTLGAWVLGGGRHHQLGSRLAGLRLGLPRAGQRAGLRQCQRHSRPPLREPGLLGSRLLAICRRPTAPVFHSDHGSPERTHQHQAHRRRRPGVEDGKVRLRHGPLR